MTCDIIDVILYALDMIFGKYTDKYVYIQNLDGNLNASFGAKKWHCQLTWQNYTAFVIVFTDPCEWDRFDNGVIYSVH